MAKEKKATEPEATEPEATEPEATEPEATAVVLVPMARDESYGAPFTADVHPDEVENYKLGGFTIKGEK